MTIATSIRSSVRNVITKLGKTCTHYDYSTATITTNDEGEDTVIVWGTGTSFKGVSSANVQVKQLVGDIGDDNDKSNRTLLIRDDTVTPAQKDKITIGTDNYMVSKVESIDPIEDDILVARIITLVEPSWPLT